VKYGFNPTIYKELLAETLPGIIESEEENEIALGVINRLMDKGEENLSPEEKRYFGLLVRLVEDFEDKMYPMGNSSTPIDTLRSLIEEHDLRQRDLIDIFGSQGVLSEILNGKRSISKTHARNLSRRFRLPVDAFI
jgi:HTH-type transcriptional regulator/antitoxin HigA